MNTVYKRLSYVLRQYPDPAVQYWTVRAALELHGVHGVGVPQHPAKLRALVDRLEARLGSNPYEKYLPWVAQQLNAMRKRQGKVDEGTAQDLSRRLRAIAEWAEAERVDLGRVDAKTAVAKAKEYEVALEDEVPQGRVVLPFDDGFTVQRLTTKEQLDAEGVAMQHCVGSYCDRVLYDKVHIYSVRDAKGNPHVTIEYNPMTNGIVQVRGKQNSEPAEKYWPYVGALIEHLNAEGGGEPPPEVLDMLTDAYEMVKKVEANAKFANETMKKAVQAFRAGDYYEALEEADDATRYEGRYGDYPSTGPLHDEIMGVIEDMEDDEDHPLKEWPKGKKHPNHQQSLTAVEKVFDNQFGSWTEMYWMGDVEMPRGYEGGSDKFYFSAETFRDVDDDDDLYNMAKTVAKELGMMDAEGDIEKYVDAARHHRWSRVANPTKRRPQPRGTVTLRPRMSIHTRRLKRRLTSY